MDSLFLFEEYFISVFTFLSSFAYHMNKKIESFLLGAVVLCLPHFFAGSVFAQSFKIMPPRFVVNSPFALSGSKNFVAANQGSSAINPVDNWGRAIDSEWLNIPLVLPADTNGCTTLAALSGSFTLLYANAACSYSQQAYAAQQAGAVGVVIIYSGSGSLPFSIPPGSLGYMVHIPVILISRPVGVGLAAQCHTGAPVYVTLTDWGFDLAHDLAFAAPLALPPYSAIPLSQVGPDNGQPLPYRLFTGAVIANTGRSNEIGVTAVCRANFIPVSGASVQVYKDSVSVAGMFSTADSVRVLVSPNTHNFSTSVLGRYSFDYSLHSSALDNYPQDNYVSAGMSVTTSTFCNASYDAVSDRPVVTTTRKFGPTSNPAYAAGPMIYVARGRFQAVSAKLAINDDNTSAHDLHNITDELVVLFKWTDTGSKNWSVEPGELSVVGMAPVHFSTSDSNNKVVTSNVFLDPVSLGQVFVEDSSWYWVAAITSSSYSLGVSGPANYYTRVLAGASAAAGPYREMWALQSDKGVDPVSFKLLESDSLYAYPLTSKARSYMPPDSLSIVSLSNSTPAMSFNIGTVNTPLATGIDKSRVKAAVSLFPNPASTEVSVDLGNRADCGPVVVYIMDLAGRVLFREVVSQGFKGKLSLNVQRYSSGDYYLICSDGSVAALNKFSIQR